MTAHTSSRMVVVTGAARGIGFACAERFAAGGDRVALIDRDAEACIEAAQRLGPQAIGLTLDVSDEDAVAWGIGEIESRHGPIDVVVNNAGIVDTHARPLLDIPVLDIERLLRVNLEGQFLVARAAARSMQRRRSGAIVNIASGAALRALPGRAAYSMTKAAVLGLTRALAVEFAPQGVAVNAVLPGYIDTEILLSLEGEGRFDRSAVASAIPAGRLGAPSEIAAAVHFAAGASYLSGSLLSADGGVDAFGGSGRASSAPMPSRPTEVGDVACVTGGASGIGAAIADRLAADGYRVAVLDTRAPAAPHAFWNVDVTNAAAIEAAFTAIAAQLGPVALLVNNAGVADPLAPTPDQTLSDFRRTIDVNLMGVINAARAAARHMIGQGGGAIVNLSSITASLGLPGRNAYCASKAGVTMLTRSLACEWAAHGIRLNAVAPGYIATPAVAALLESGQRDRGAILSRIPMGRLGDPSEVAAAVAFLGSDAASYVTGTTLQVDGGYLASGHPPGGPMP